MVSLSKKIEVASNIAIIITAVLISSVLVKTYLLPNSSNTNPVSPVGGSIIGKKIIVADINFVENQRTLILSLQSTCRFCNESASFYKRLVEKQSTQSKTKLIAVFSEPVDTGRYYLDSLGVSIPTIKQASLGTIGITGTPALLLVDGKGIVSNFWVGKLDAKRENEVMTQLQ